jgi:chaperonin cofactor prefoldin
MRIKIAILLLILSFPLIHGVWAQEEIVLTLELFPDINYHQIILGETYTFSLNIENSGVDIGKDGTLPGSMDLQYTGRIIVEFLYNWLYRGTYHFGNSVTGYSGRIDETRNISRITLPSLNETVTVSLNRTFDRDYFDLGVKPTDDLIINFESSVYLEILNTTSGETGRGDKLDTLSIEFFLLDDIKTNYVEGKLVDLEEELIPLMGLPKARTTLDEDYFLDFMQEMEEYIDAGNYYAALDVYRDYDTTERDDMIFQIIGDLNSTLDKASRIPELEDRIDRLEQDYERLQEQYLELQETYHDNAMTLENQRRLTTTALAVIPLAAFFSFILGRFSRRFNLD